MRRLLLPFAALAALLPANAPTAALAGPLVADAGMARYALAADEQLLLDALDPASRAVFATALGDDFGAAGSLWSDIIAGALQVRREDGDQAEVLWFNPLFEAGLASRWQRRGETWQAVAAIPVTAESLRQTSALAVNPLWMDAEFPGAELERSAAEFWALAAQGDWFASDPRGTGAVALSRVILARSSVQEMLMAPGMDRAGRHLREVLVERPDDELPLALQNVLGRMGAEARLSLRPIAALFRAGGWSLAMQSPDAPRLALLVHFNAVGSEPTRVMAIETIDLGSGE
jgi:hypothetical protein